jgi:hypothetical protein
VLRLDPGHLPSAGTLRRIRWTLCPRSRDCRPSPLGFRCSRWMTISRHPGPVCRASVNPRFRAGLHDLRRSLRPLTPPPAFTVDTLTELGPCSLAPAALFGARLTSVFETRCRLPTSATTNDVRATKPGLADPCWDEGHDLLPVLPCLRTFLRRQGHGASRATSVEKRPVLVPPGYPVCPAAIRFSSPPCGGRRARVEGPSEGCVPSCREC